MPQKQPIGIELAKRNLITEEDINKALDYQKRHPGKKLGDVINILHLCDSNELIQAIGETKHDVLVPSKIVSLIKVEDMDVAIDSQIIANAKKTSVLSNL